MHTALSEYCMCSYTAHSDTHAQGNNSIAVVTQELKHSLKHTTGTVAAIAQAIVCLESVSLKLRRKCYRAKGLLHHIWKIMNCSACIYSLQDVANHTGLITLSRILTSGKVINESELTKAVIYHEFYYNHR